jgi:hypothetical protein
MTNTPTTTELREAITRAVQHNRDAFLDDTIITVDLAVEEIEAGNVQPWHEYEGTDPAEALALQVIMWDGPWWLPDTPQENDRRIRECINHLRIKLPARQAEWDRLIDDEAYAVYKYGYHKLEELDPLIKAACERILAAWDSGR